MKFRHIVISSLSLLLCCSCTEKESISSSAICEDINLPIHPKSIAFQSVIEQYTQKGIPGIALLVKDNDGVWLGSSGKADIAQGIPMQACHISKVASLTKIFMGALAFKLSEEGTLDLDKPIKEYLTASQIKNIANADQVSSRQLLNHTTGIFDVIQDNGFYLDVLNNPPKHRDATEILNYVRGKNAVFPAGSSSAYSNTNTLLLGLIIDKATGISHHQLLHDKIIVPLGLQHTYYFYHDALPEGKVAQGYYDLFNNGSIVNVSNYNTGSGNGYTGLYTNLNDLLLFSEALFEDKTLVNATSLTSMLTFNTVKEADADRYLGQGTMKDFIMRSQPDEYAWGHRGRDLGYSADLFYFPEKQQTFILIVNYGTDGESQLRPHFYDLRKAIVDEMMRP